MRKTLILLLLTALIVTACAQQSATTLPTNPPPTPEQAAIVEQPTAIPETEVITEQAVEERPAIQTLTLTNASSGESFTLGDFSGRTVLVEPMATWCTNCRAQLRNVVQANDQLDDDYVFIGLSVGENITNSNLANYAQQQGFDLIFAIATPEMLAELTSTFGRASITPPSTPHFVIRPDGSMTELFTGAKGVDALVSLLTEASGA